MKAPAPESSDEKLDALLASQPVRPGDAFLENTLAEIRRTPQESAPAAADASESGRRVLRFKPWLAGLGLAAAAALVAALLLSDGLRPPAPAPEPDRSPPATDPAPAGLVRADETPAPINPEAVTMEELMTLEDNLEDLEFLLEGDNLEALLILAETVPS